MRELFLRREVFREDGSRLELNYYRLTHRRGAEVHYGAEIILLDGTKLESAAVRWLTTQPACIQQFLELLSRNAVTPCTLQDVVEDAMNKF